ncbi:gamma-glutamylcyclotransferase [Micromonospora sp. LOL_024]|uniref:gamma-glutamylcyclotransferase n=1 Tax=Micromonospora sp. LOL_024 TaxID=3345412 RepID=UPI003A880C6F
MKPNPRCDDQVATDASDEKEPALPVPEDGLDTGMFVYDALKPGEIAHDQIRAEVLCPTDAWVEGYVLRNRDGRPLLVRQRGGRVHGSLLIFKSPRAAYEKVGDYEPANHYTWARDGIEVQTATGVVAANALLAVNEQNGSELEESDRWSSGMDPVFVHGVPAAARIARPYLAEREGPWEALFHIQAAHLLIWSAVERFAALMFGRQHTTTSRPLRLGKVDDWQELVQQAQIETEGRRVYDSRRPRNPINLGSGQRAWDYWYQVRCNLAHRGKGGGRDMKIVRDAFVDVHDMLRLLLVRYAPGIEEQWKLADPDGADRRPQWRIWPTLRGNQ